MPLANQLADFNRRFSFTSDGLGSGAALEVVNFEGEESLGRLYRFEILLVSASNDIDEQMLLGRHAEFQLHDGTPGGEPTRYSGLVTRFEQLHRITGWTFYRAVLEPKLWRLGKFHLTEVYLNKTPRELLEIILDAAGLSSNDYNLSYLQPAAYPQQKFICQYRESYLSFLTRWCEHLGVYWWYAQQGNGEQIVFGNSYLNHDPHVVGLAYQPAGELDADVTGARRVQHFNLSSQPLPRQVTVTNYFYRKASLQIKGTAIVSEHGIGDVNYYGMHVESNETAREVARIRAEGLICRGRQFNGESTATGLRCGHFLELSGHYRASFNRKYLLTRVSHRGSQAGLLLAGLGVQTAESDQTFYRADFSAIPSDVQFRLELQQPWPRIEGTLNAFIDAEGDGKYAELNDEGEYKVQLPYYLTEKDATKASAWIRMASPYGGEDDAGSAYGMNFPLHKGTEVLLSFHNGNPDKPVIIGAVTNSQTRNVVTNENQTQSKIRTAGGNEITLQDKQGKQQMLFKTPTADTWMSMGATGKPSSGLRQIPGANITNPETGGEGVWINAGNGNFGVTTGSSSPAQPPDGISLIAYTANITLTSTLGNITLNTLNGDINQNIKGKSNTKVEGSSSIWRYSDSTSFNYGDTTSIFGGDKNQVMMGVQLSGYAGLVLNVYAGPAVNFYGFKLDNSLIKMEKVYGAHLEKKGLHFTAAAARLAKNEVKLTQDEIKVLKQGASVINTSTAEIKQATATIDECETKMEDYATALMQGSISFREFDVLINSRQTEIAQAETKIENAQATLSSGAHIFIPA